jgi:hypothetical protein
VTDVNENAVRDLFAEVVATEDPPPSTVSITAAQRSGRRRLRVRRIYLPGLAPVAAAVAVALIATLPATLHSTEAVRPAPHVRLRAEPRPFNPLVPYASFGWLPAGFSADASAAGAADEATSTSVTLQAIAPSASGQIVTVTVNAAGSCKITGSGVMKILSNRRTARSQPSSARTVRGFRLACDAGAGNSPLMARLRSLLPRISAVVAPDVNGRPAFWTSAGTLVWEYASGGWATLSPDGLAGHALLLKIASHVRYGDTTPVLFGFRLAKLPVGWGPSGIIDFAPHGGRLLAISWSAGPTVDPTALSVGVFPPVRHMGSPSYCNFVAGQSRYATLDGTRTLVRNLNEPYKHWQSLCANDIDGVQLYLTLDLNTPGSNTPLPGSNEFNGVLTVFRHLQLLGPNPGAWTTAPVG